MPIRVRLRRAAVVALLSVLTLGCMEPVTEARQGRERRSADVVEAATEVAAKVAGALSGPVHQDGEGDRTPQPPPSTARTCVCAYALLSLTTASESMAATLVTPAPPRIDRLGMPASPTLERQLRPPVGAA